jgi:acyl dehydratase
MADAILDDNPVWRDLAPPTFVDSLNPFYAGEPYPVWGGFPHFFSAGDAFTFHAPIHVGDVIDVDCRIESIREKTRADGTSRMQFVTYLKRYRRAGELCVEERWTCVLFDGDRTASPAPPAPNPEWATVVLPGFSRVIDPLTIVRWTAASNDFERIHFDHVYAVEECGLPGIVAHGPCSAALLLKVITDRLDDPRRLTHAEFRYRSPVYANDELTFGAFASSDPAAPEAGRAVLVSTYAGGASTTGTATWSAGRGSAATPSRTSESMSSSE